jgi:hypothetical protein
MRALIAPRFFSRLKASAPAGVVPSSSILTHIRFCNVAFNFLRKKRSLIPHEIVKEHALGRQVATARTFSRLVRA